MGNPPDGHIKLIQHCSARYGRIHPVQVVCLTIYSKYICNHLCDNSTESLRVYHHDWLLLQFYKFAYLKFGRI